MTRTLEETRSRSWAAAAVEPAELEPDGTTVTRIAARAGIDEVLTEAVEELSSAVAPEGLRFDDLGESAGRTLDHYRQHPELARSLQWQGLRGAPPVQATARVAHHRRRIGATAHVQPDGVIDSRIDDLAGADADAHGRLGAGDGHGGAQVPAGVLRTSRHLLRRRVGGEPQDEGDHHVPAAAPADGCRAAARARREGRDGDDGLARTSRARVGGLDVRGHPRLG